MFNFFALALCTWAYIWPPIDYGYCALERAQKRELQFDPDRTLAGAEPTPE